MPQRHSLCNNMKKDDYKINKKQILMNTLKEKNFTELFYFKYL